MKKVALIIIYNHQYNKNIEILENIYKARFSNIYHLVPFYNGDKQNVIAVYENSYYFQGYIAQGLKSYFNESYSHYFFVADDMVLNPVINEINYTEHLNLNNKTSFIPGFITLHERKTFWPRLNEAFRWNVDVKGVEAKNQLPGYENAVQIFKQFDLKIKPLNFSQVWGKPNSIKNIGWIVLRDKLYLLRLIKHIFRKKGYYPSFPFVGSYSDIFVVSSDTIKEFCHYCGVFATTNLFVELAIPTSLVLSAKEIVTENDLKLQGKALWGEKQEKQELDKYNNSLKTLFDEFPDNYLYLHPIKLSKWNINL